MARFLTLDGRIGSTLPVGGAFMTLSRLAAILTGCLILTSCAHQDGLGAGAGGRPAFDYGDCAFDLDVSAGYGPTGYGADAPCGSVRLGSALWYGTSGISVPQRAEVIATTRVRPHTRIITRPANAPNGFAASRSGTSSDSNGSASTVSGTASPSGGSISLSRPTASFSPAPPSGGSPAPPAPKPH